MRRKKIIFSVVTGWLALCVAGYFLLPLLIFRPVHLTDTDFLHERGMFQDVELVQCDYTEDLMPDMKRWISLLCPIELSYFGTAKLTDESLAELLRDYTWEEYTITEAQWENRDYDVFAQSMRYFKNLKSKYVGKTVWISHDFNRERMSYGGDGRAYLLPGTHTMLFYYHRM